MKIAKRTLLACFLFIGWTTAFAAESYKSLDPAQPPKSDAKVEVIEFFSYACGHCATLDPALEEWLKNKKPEAVTFIRIPAIFRPNWEPLARAYYVAEVLDVTDKTHAALFHAIHQQKQNLSSKESLAKFFAQQGVPEADFNRAYSGFSMPATVGRGKQAFLDYKVFSVPTLVVNAGGKTLMTDSTMAGSHERAIQVVDQLVTEALADTQ